MNRLTPIAVLVGAFLLPTGCDRAAEVASDIAGDETVVFFDELFMALADPTRRAIVARLAAGSSTVGELAKPFDMSLAAVSKHIQVLDRAGLVTRDRQGRSIVCSLNPAQLKTMSDWIGDYEAFWNDRLTKLEQVIKDSKRRPE